jgi:hypothetical protein
MVESRGEVAIAMSQRRKALQDTPAESREIRTLIVDDHPVFREALRDLVTAAAGFVRAGENGRARRRCLPWNGSRHNLS